MAQISLVFAGPDVRTAQEIAGYLERNCSVQIENLVVTGREPLLNMLARALSSDFAIVLLSPDSVPQKLERAEWEPLLVTEAQERSTEIGYLRLAETPFPKVLLRHNLFDPAAGMTECLRAIKRWILKPATGQHPYCVPDGPKTAASAPAIDPLWALADEPTSATVTDAAAARGFAERAHADFEGVFWIRAAGATLAGVAGELAAQLGMRLAGELESNLDSIRRLFERHRSLVVMEGAAPGVQSELRILGRASVLFVAAPVPAVSLELVRSRLHSLAIWVNNRAGAPHPGEINSGLEWLLEVPEHWRLARELGRAALAFYLFQDRCAEALEITERLMEGAARRNDSETGGEFARERDWILASWGQPGYAPAPPASPPPGVQLALW